MLSSFSDSVLNLIVKTSTDLPPDVRAAMRGAMASEQPDTRAGQALTIIAQALMALIFGFLGLLCAVPMLAATMVAVKMLYVQDVVGEPVEVFEDLDDDD